MYLEHRLSALLQLHLDSRLNIWLQGIRQRQPQDSTRIFYVLRFGATYIRDLTVMQLQWYRPFTQLSITGSAAAFRHTFGMTSSDQSKSYEIIESHRTGKKTYPINFIVSAAYAGGFTGIGPSTRYSTRRTVTLRQDESMMTSSNGTFSALLVICEGNPSITGGFPSQRPVTQNTCFLSSEQTVEQTLDTTVLETPWCSL